MKVPMSKREREALTGVLYAASQWLIFVCRTIKNGPGSHYSTELRGECAAVVDAAAELSDVPPSG